VALGKTATAFTASTTAVGAAKSVTITVTVPMGALSATFAIGTTKQTIQKIVTVSATSGGKPVVGKVTVKP
jgi:hypothetical protein